MNYRELSEKLLSLLGGKDNILGNAACMTRLRISVRDLSIVDIEAIKKSGRRARRRGIGNTSDYPGAGKGE